MDLFTSEDGPARFTACLVPSKDFLGGSSRERDGGAAIRGRERVDSVTVLCKTSPPSSERGLEEEERPPVSKSMKEWRALFRGLGVFDELDSLGVGGKGF